MAGWVDLEAWEFRPVCSLAHMQTGGQCPNPAVATARLPHSAEHGEELQVVFLCGSCLVAHRMMAAKLPGPCPFCGMPLHKPKEWIDDVSNLPYVL